MIDQQGRNYTLARQHGMTVVETFGDPAMSRSVGERPEFTAMLSYLRERRDVHFLVVNELDRLVGDLRQRVRVEAVCQELGITLVTEQGLIEPLDEDQQFEADRNALEAAAEVRKGRRRTRGAMKQKVLGGTVMMRPAFGTRSKPVLSEDGQELPSGTLLRANGKLLRSGELEVVADELAWVRQMFQWVADEHLSIDQVARRLTARGVRTKSNRSSWSRSSVKGILTNRFYLGEVVWGHTRTVRTATGTKLVLRDVDDPERIVMDSPLGTLIDRSLWKRANEVIAARAGTRPHQKRRKNPPRAFDGIVFCARCGHKMYGRADAKPLKDGSKPDIWRYYCVATRPGYGPVEGFGPPCRKSNAVAEHRIIEALSKVATDPEQATISVRYTPSDDVAQRAGQLRHERDELVRRWKNTVELGVEGVLDAAEMKRRKADYNVALSHVEAALRDLTAAPPDEPAEFNIQAAEALRKVCVLLRERSLPADVLRRGLEDMGLRRVYADGPSVQFDWIP